MTSQCCQYSFPWFPYPDTRIKENDGKLRIPPKCQLIFITSHGASVFHEYTFSINIQAGSNQWQRLSCHTNDWKKSQKIHPQNPWPPSNKPAAIEKRISRKRTAMLIMVLGGRYGWTDTTHLLCHKHPCRHSSEDPYAEENNGYNVEHNNYCSRDKQKVQELQDKRIA